MTTGEGGYGVSGGSSGSTEGVPPGASGASDKSKLRPLTDDEIRTIAVRGLDRALQYERDTLEPERLEAQRMYEGDDPKLVKIEGRSSYQARDVRDTIHAILPSLMRIFFGSDRVAEYVPVTPADVKTAESATEAAAYVIRKCGGFNTLYTAMLDALKLKTGTVKVWWNESKKVEIETFRGITADQFAMLTTPDSDDSYGDDDPPEVEVIEFEEVPPEAPPEGEEAAAPPPQGAEGAQPPAEPLINCTLKTIRKGGSIAIEAVPPEQRLIDPRARVYFDARFYAHRVVRTLGELVSQGYDWSDVFDVSGTDGYDENVEKTEREDKGTGTVSEANTDEDIDPTARRVIYYECFLYADKDGDGVPEYLRVCLAGNERKLLHVGEWGDGFCFAEFCPDPSPHVATGKSTADSVMDIQRVKSQLGRALLDSLAQSVFPQRGYSDGMVNLDDLKDTSVGALVRCQGAPNTLVQEWTREFSGPKVMPVVEYFDQIKESRTGISAASRGLDPETLQSTTAAAVNATITAAQAQIETVARLFAENGMKQLFRVILRLLVRHHNYAETVSLPGGAWFEFNPREWNPDMDVVVNTGLGRGTDQEKLAAMAGVMQDQEKIMAAGGMDNPLVSPQEIFNAEKRKLEFAGVMDAHRYFKNPATQPPKQEKPPKPDPAMLLAQAELKKAEAEAEKARVQAIEVQVNARIKAFEAVASAEHDRDKLLLDSILEAAKIEGETGTTIDTERLYAEVERDRDYRNFIMQVIEATQPELPMPGGPESGPADGASPAGSPSGGPPSVGALAPSGPRMLGNGAGGPPGPMEPMGG